MNIQLPDAFVNRMRGQLRDELPAFLNALEEPPVRGIRENRLKPAETSGIFSRNEPVQWAENAFYLDAGSAAGLSVLHEAGAYYIQEPAAMLPAAVLSAAPGESVLDLCAAPGGKTTQIGTSMMGQGLLVSNEPVPKRASILSRNIERTGLPNTVVTCAWPEQLVQRWPEGFDAVLVDAPCSGEGMFRRDPQTRREWSAEKAEGCASRQREILSAAAGLVRQGGRLVYSTCTYNPQENEDMIRWFTDRFPEFSTEAFSLPGIEAPNGMYTCYPHRIRGEGQFAAKLRKAGNAQGCIPSDHTMKAPAPEIRKAFEAAFPFLPGATHLLGNTLIYAPMLPDLTGIRTIRTGLHLGEVRGKTAVPDHAAALCFQVPHTACVDLDPDQVLRYTAGEMIDGDAEGWVLLRYRGLAVGWGKGSGGYIKNHYPKGLRCNRLLP